MAGFVGQYIHITGGSIKVAEDERGFIIGDLGAVAARGLAIAGKHIKQLVLKHKVNELRRLGRKLLVHLLAGRQNLIRGALRYGVAIRKADRLIVKR